MITTPTLIIIIFANICVAVPRDKVTMEAELAKIQMYQNISDKIREI